MGTFLEFLKNLDDLDNFPPLLYGMPQAIAIAFQLLFLAIVSTINRTFFYLIDELFSEDS